MENSQLRQLYRYRDDCTSINFRNFLTISQDIYPPSLSLTQENDQFIEANVLDMQVKIEGGNIITKVFCKTDLFPFHVISLPFLESNLNSRICYKVFYGQVIRFQRLCNYQSDFEERVKFLLDTLLGRGYNFGMLKREFCKSVNKYISEFQRWAIPLDFDKWFINISRNIPSSVSSQPAI